MEIIIALVILVLAALAASTGRSAPQEFVIRAEPIEAGGGCGSWGIVLVVIVVVVVVLVTAP